MPLSERRACVGCLAFIIPYILTVVSFHAASHPELICCPANTVPTYTRESLALDVLGLKNIGKNEQPVQIIGPPPEECVKARAKQKGGNKWMGGASVSSTHDTSDDCTDLDPPLVTTSAYMYLAFICNALCFGIEAGKLVSDNEDTTRGAYGPEDRPCCGPSLRVIVYLLFSSWYNHAFTPTPTNGVFIAHSASDDPYLSKLVSYLADGYVTVIFAVPVVFLQGLWSLRHPSALLEILWAGVAPWLSISTGFVIASTSSVSPASSNTQNAFICTLVFGVLDFLIYLCELPRASSDVEPILPLQDREMGTHRD